MMNRKMRKIADKEGRRLQSLPWNKFKDVTQEAREKHFLLNGNCINYPDKVFQNNKYIVQLFYNKMRDGVLYDKYMIRRSDALTVSNWNDLYKIKNEIIGEEIEAVMFFPKKSELTDVANLYWLFVRIDK